MFKWDLTGRKEYLQRNTETLFRAVIENARDSIFMKNINQKYILVNPAMERLFGMPAAEIMGKTDADLFGEEAGRHIQAVDARVLAGETIEEEHTKTVKGVNIIFHVIKAPIKDKTGQIIGFCGIARDITERRQSESNISKLSSAIEQINDSIIITDTNGVIEYVNPGFEKDSGYSKEEALGKKTSILKMRMVTGSLYGVLWNEILAGRIFNAEFVNRRKDGKKYYTDKTIWPITNKAGKITNFISIDRDITQRKEIEKSQRFTQLGKLVGNMAHEVNNPLMVISGRAQLSMMEDIQNEELKKNLQIIYNESLRAKDMIQRMLKFARPTQGRVKPGDINKILEELIALIEHQFSLDNVKIVKSYAEGLPQVNIDEKHMQEVFMNLLNNSREAMPNGGQIKVATCKSGEQVKITFEDSGSGMSAEVRAKLFEPFFTTKDKGTGLGLSVSYSIVKAHGGELDLESSLGKGTVASISLPVIAGGGGNV